MKKTALERFVCEVGLLWKGGVLCPAGITSAVILSRASGVERSRDSIALDVYLWGSEVDGMSELLTFWCTQVSLLAESALQLVGLRLNVHLQFEKRP